MYDSADDLSIDYKYSQGDAFRYDGRIAASQRLKLSDADKEYRDYSDMLADLCFRRGKTMKTVIKGAIAP